eukprot:TRINITY_DN17620_c0_g5_i1.p1 TRINITY_DN17620_c0_g5~~TRINITY_DN17620_c0_g5_i1.p1  ORF type:complete len:290 (+),score=26.78 TRINITY_DN17620_c0_g5_i1:24-872(+)
MSTCNQEKYIFREGISKYVFRRLADTGSQVLQCSLRTLNRSCNKLFEKSINSAKVEPQNLEKLAKENVLKQQIQNLRIEIAADKYITFDEDSDTMRIDDLPILQYKSPKYFPNLKSIELFFVNMEKINLFTRSGRQLTAYCNLRENFSLNGVSITSNFDFVFELSAGIHDVEIVDVKFDRLGLEIYEGKHVKIINTQFSNAKEGFIGNECEQLEMDMISAYNCGAGVKVYDVPNFTLDNACMQICGKLGVFVWWSTGRITNLVVDNSKQDDIKIESGSNYAL